MNRRRVLLACAAVLLAGAVSYVFAQSRGRSASEPYRVVIIEDIGTSSSRRIKDRFMESRRATEALNQLAAEGYQVVSMSSLNNDRMIVILRKP